MFTSLSPNTRDTHAPPHVSISSSPSRKAPESSYPRHQLTKHTTVLPKERDKYQLCTPALQQKQTPWILTTQKKLTAHSDRGESNKQSHSTRVYSEKSHTREPVSEALRNYCQTIKGHERSQRTEHSRSTGVILARGVFSSQQPAWIERWDEMRKRECIRDLPAGEWKEREGRSRAVLF